MSRILLLVAAVLGAAACSQCKCADQFCVYTLDGGGCGYSYADCSKGTPLCFTANGALSGPVPDAGADCAYASEKDPVCAE